MATTTPEWTAERALVAARNSDISGFRWLYDATAEPRVAHSFPIMAGWMHARCDTARWTVNWWMAPEGTARCEECSEISEAAIAREAAAILAVAARAVVVHAEHDDDPDPRSITISRAGEFTIRRHPDGCTAEFGPAGDRLSMWQRIPAAVA